MPDHPVGVRIRNIDYYMEFVHIGSICFDKQTTVTTVHSVCSRPSKKPVSTVL